MEQLLDLGWGKCFWDRRMSAPDGLELTFKRPSLTMQTATFFPPGLAPVTFTQIGQVSDDAVRGSGEEFFVFVVHGHDDEEFDTAGRVVMDLAKGESVVFEVFGVAGGGGVAHMGTV